MTRILNGILAEESARRFTSNDGLKFTGGLVDTSSMLTGDVDTSGAEATADIDVLEDHQDITNVTVVIDGMVVKDASRMYTKDNQVFTGNVFNENIVFTADTVIETEIVQVPVPGLEGVFLPDIRKKELPKQIKQVKVKQKEMNIVDLLVETKLMSSRGEAKRKIREGAIDVDGKRIKDIKQIVKLTKPVIVRAGKHKFLKVAKK